MTNDHRTTSLWGPPVRPGYWFAPKRYGIGAVPATAMGWVATAVFLSVFGTVVAMLHSPFERVVIGGAIVITYVAIVWLKTDGGFAWRWGGEDK